MRIKSIAILAATLFAATATVSVSAEAGCGGGHGGFKSYSSSSNYHTKKRARARLAAKRRAQARAKAKAKAARLAKKQKAEKLAKADTNSTYKSARSTTAILTSGPRQASFNQDNGNGQTIATDSSNDGRITVAATVDAECSRFVPEIGRSIAIACGN